MTPLAPGAFFDAAAALAGRSVASTYTACGSIEVAAASTDRFLDEVQSHSDLSRALTIDLALQVLGAADRWFELSTMPVQARVCAELHRIGRSPSGSAVSIADLARRVNATRESVSRVINALMRRRIITRRDGHIVVCDWASLPSAEVLMSRPEA